MDQKLEAVKNCKKYWWLYSLFEILVTLFAIQSKDTVTKTGTAKKEFLNLPGPWQREAIRERWH